MRGEVGKEDLRLGGVAWVSAQNGVMTAGVGAEDDRRPGRHFQAEALGADGDTGVVAGFEDGALAPDVGPPRAAGHGTQRGAVFLYGDVPSVLRFHLKFAVDFVLVAVEAQGAHLRVGVREVGDVFAGEEGGEAVLPELVFAFDFAFGLRGGRVAEGDAIEVQRLAELGEGFRNVREEEGMEVHIEFEGQTAFEESGGEEVEVGQEGFAFVEFGTGEEAAAIVEHVEHGKDGVDTGQPTMGRGVELPEFTDLGTLPAADGGGHFRVPLGMGELIFDGPATDLGAAQGEATEALDLAGGEAVVGGRF